MPPEPLCACAFPSEEQASQMNKENEMGGSVMSTDNQSAQSAPTWRCFHCDEEFTDAALAEQHFGRSEHQRPACQINVAEYRAMEGRMQRYNEEDSDLHRHIHRIESEHQQALMREEEAGYAKGLADGRSALAQAPAPSGEAPEGWVLVPKEATWEMQQAALDASRKLGPLVGLGRGEYVMPKPAELWCSAFIYKAMIAAAPKGASK